ncbi:unnamed protein product [Discosporangium mesarthrocarpum]
MRRERVSSVCGYGYSYDSSDYRRSDRSELAENVRVRVGVRAARALPVGSLYCTWYSTVPLVLQRMMTRRYRLYLAGSYLGAGLDWNHLGLPGSACFGMKCWHANDFVRWIDSPIVFTPSDRYSARILRSRQKLKWRQHLPSAPHHIAVPWHSAQAPATATLIRFRFVFFCV